MTRIALAFLLAIAIPATSAMVAVIATWGTGAQAERAGVDSAIVFVADTSGSMDMREIITIREAHAAALTSEDVLTAISGSYFQRIAVAYVEFSDSASIRIGWTIIDGPETAAAFAAQITARGMSSISGGGTSVVAGLEVAAAALYALPYRADRMVVDIIGDGIGFSRVLDIPAARETILSQGAVINTIPLMIDPSSTNVDQWYMANVQAGAGSFTMPSKTLEELPMTLRSKILLEGW